MASQVESIKWIPNTRFLVDGFRFADPPNQPGVTYFLTHYHGDHYCGLPRRFGGVIYASSVTCDLLLHDYRLRVGGASGATLVRMPLGRRLEVDGVGVTAIHSNHCPGAVMLLFEVPVQGGGTHVVLHTGDCRWQDWIRDTTVLATTRVDTLMLDTTYCLPRYTFPPQEDAIAMMVQVCVGVGVSVGVIGGGGLLWGLGTTHPGLAEAALEP